MGIEKASHCRGRSSYIVVMLMLVSLFSVVFGSTAHAAATAPISISIKNAGYQKVNTDFELRGIVKGLKGKRALELTIDGKRVSTVETDDKGSFKSVVPISAYKTGIHYIGLSLKYGKKTYTSSKNVSYVKYMVYDVKGISKDTVLTDRLNVSGFAIADKGIREVSVYVDNMYRPIKKMVPSLLSTEAAMAYPNYTSSSSSGFSYSTGIKSLMSKWKLKYGPHKVRVKVVSKSGEVAYSDFTVEFAKRKAIAKVDSDPGGMTLENSNIQASGWFIHPDGQESIVATIDGEIVSDIASGMESGDIGSKYVDYANSSGARFSISIPKDKVRRGSHSLQISFYSGDKKVSQKTYGFQMVKPDYHMTTDKPSFINTAGEQAILVNGFSAHPAGIRDISVYVNDQLQAGVSRGGHPTSSHGKYTGYSGMDSSGFAIRLDTSGWTLEPHTIRIVATANDGETFEYSDLIGLSGVNYAFMKNTLSYYTDLEFAKGLNVGPYNFSKKATLEEIAYAMDPLQFIYNDQYKYMFMKLDYVDGVSASDLNAILSGKGILNGKGSVFLEAARKYDINPIYLVSHALLETGNGTSKLANGTLVNTISYKVIEGGIRVTKSLSVNSPKVVYNMYGVGAFDDNPLLFGTSTAYMGGSQYNYMAADYATNALNGNLAWDTVDKAIIGGASFISKGYINDGRYAGYYAQNTLYKMKWDIGAMDNGTSPHQYATDAGWAWKQTKRIKEIVDQMGNPKLEFEVPIFKTGLEPDVDPQVSDEAATY